MTAALLISAALLALLYAIVAQPLYELDIGTPKDREDLVLGETFLFNNRTEISATSENALFSSHRFGKDFSYYLTVPPGSYDVTLQVAETFSIACTTGFRIFDVFAFDANRTAGAGQRVVNVDVFQAVGCFKALSLNISSVIVTGSELLRIRFLARSNNAMISGIIVTRVDSSRESLSSPSSIPAISSASQSSPTPISSTTSSLTPSPTTLDFPSSSPSSLSSPLASNTPIPSTTPSPPSNSHSPSPSPSTISPSLSPSLIPSESLPSTPVATSALPSPTATVSSPLSSITPLATSASPSPSLTAASRTPSPTPTSSTVPPRTEPTTDRVLLNVGAPTDIDVSGTEVVSITSSVKGTENAPSSVYQTAREGKRFQYEFNLNPGAYDITLGFVETYDSKNCKEPGKRVFNVYVNNLLQLEGFDIFSKAGCFNGTEVVLTQSVSTVIKEPMVIRFESVVGKAQLSFLSINPAKASCIPESLGGELSSDHAAHSVPGTYPPRLSASSPKSYIDTVGEGFVTVFIDGSGSHTHFSDSKNDILGRLTKKSWTLTETGEVISNATSFFYRFPLGTTRLKLSVIDNSCSTDEAETTVTVTGAVQPGQYCYYYSGLTEVPVGGTLLNDPRPLFSAASESLNLNFPSFPFSGEAFAARCFFFLQVDQEGKNTIEIKTDNTGVARVYKGADLIADSEEEESASKNLPVGLTLFEVTYLRTKLDEDPKLRFIVNGKIPSRDKFSYDRKTVVPILSSVTPGDGSIFGGTQLKLTGYGLYQPLSVTIGETTVPILPFGTTESEFLVNAPAASEKGVVNIVANTSSNLSSNQLKFLYGSTCDAVQFDYLELKKFNGRNVDFFPLATSITIGHDQRLYIGVLGGSVHVLAYNTSTLRTTSNCYSKPIIDPQFSFVGSPSQRDIIGIAIDPRDKEIRPYVSASTIFPSKRIDSSNTAVWRNAAVERLKPGKDTSDPDVCLVYDRRIVSGLPVSNRDHTVSSLVFTNDGDLLIGVGGATNMGLPGFRLGNYWESPLSGSIVLARLSKSDFDGTVTYSVDTPELATQLSGDVEVFAGGFRNPFSMTMDSKGQVFATDQGPNCNFGNVASSCSDFDEDAARTRTESSPDWRAATRVPAEDCRTSSATRPDKIVLVERGMTYGHANLRRGGDECAWIDPFTGRSVLGSRPGRSYQAPITLVNRPATGLGVYNAKHFCEALRGDLITSAFGALPSFRVGISRARRTSGPDQLMSTGGIAFKENAYGDLVFIRHNSRRMFVMRPRISQKARLYVAGFYPIRYGRDGGNPLTIGGMNFGKSPKVSVDGKTCVVTKSSDSEITCTMPAHGPGSKTVAVTNDTGERETTANAVLYMNV